MAEYLRGYDHSGTDLLRFIVQYIQCEYNQTGTDSGSHAEKAGHGTGGESG